MRVYVDGSGGPGGVSVYVDGVSSRGGPVPLPAKAYVQSGLIAMWDGIENAGWGVHDGVEKKWTELVSGVRGSIAEDFWEWGDKSFRYTRNKNMARSVEFMKGEEFFLSDKTWEFAGSLATSVSNAAGFRGQTILGFRQKSRTGPTRYDTEILGMQPLNASIPVADAFVFESTLQVDGAYPASTVVVSGSLVMKDNGDGTFTLTAYKSGQLLGSKVYDYAPYDSSATTPGTPNVLWTGANGSDLFFHRVYGRALTAQEIAYNHALDVERFGLEA